MRHSWKDITFKTKGGEIRTSYQECKRAACKLKKKTWYMRATQYQFPGEQTTINKTPPCRGDDIQLTIKEPSTETKD